MAFWKQTLHIQPDTITQKMCTSSILTVEFVEKSYRVVFALDGVDQSIFIILHIHNTHVIYSFLT